MYKDLLTFGMFGLQKRNDLLSRDVKTSDSIYKKCHPTCYRRQAIFNNNVMTQYVNKYSLEYI